MGFFESLCQWALPKVVKVAMSTAGGMSSFFGLALLVTEPDFVRYIRIGSIFGAACGLGVYWLPRQLSRVGIMKAHPFRKPWVVLLWVVGSAVLGLGLFMLHDWLWQSKDLSERGLSAAQWCLAGAALVLALALTVAFAAYADYLLQSRKPANTP